MSRIPKIAIYSGVIPSTTFIERLIVGLCKRNNKILLFGILKEGPQYGRNIKVIGYGNNKIRKIIHYLKYHFLLTYYKNKDKRRLDNWLKESGKDRWALKLKFYPVLYHRPEIFHIQWAKSLDDWKWVKLFNIKLVLSLRGAHINYSPLSDKDLAASYKRNFKKVDAFHAVSKAIMEEAAHYGTILNKTKVIYSGLDQGIWADSIRSSNNPKLKILSVGRCHWIKGYSYSLDAMKKLSSRLQDFEYSIIGAKKSIELLYQINDLNLAKYVFLQPEKSFKDTIAQIKEADVMLLPSVEEGIANVVLEAMAVGTLVLSTDCGGMSEVIENGENGFLVPIRNSMAMANKLLEIYNMDDSELRFMKQNARETIQENHTEVHMVEGMDELYSHTLSDSPI